MKAQLLSRSRHQISDLMPLEVTPDVFHGIELGGVGRQALNPQPAQLSPKHLIHRLGTMDRRSVPDHRQWSRQMPEQFAKECSDLWTADRPLVKSEVEAMQRRSPNQGELVPIGSPLKHRRLATRRPSAHSVGARAQSALVDEDDRAAFSARFLLMAGHVRAFHAAIFASFRSTARRVGCWQLMPSERSKCHTWPG